jgi:GT2 family glycosyltransferase
VNIWASVLHWGHAEDTWAAIDSLIASTRPPDGIVVIDNAADQLLDPRRASGAGVILRREPANLGFAAGQNRGVATALERGAEAVLLLNNDAAVAPTALEQLAGCLSEHPGIGILGPCIRGASPPHLIESAGISLNLNTGRMRLRFHGRSSLPAGPEVEEVDAVSGAALLATRALIDRVGYLRPEYFCYFEEVDWCLRARAAGFRIALRRGAEARHHGRANTRGKGAAMAAYYGTRNHLRCLSRNAPRGPFRGRVRTGHVALLNMVHALRGPQRRARFAASMEGVRDAKLRVFGPRSDHPGARFPPPLPQGAPPPRVAVVVLAWNRPEETMECLKSLASCKTRQLEIILVDNGSRETVVPAAKEKFQAIHVIQNKENLGYAGGNNVGLRYALSLGADYALVLNNDAVVAPEAIDEMVRMVESDPDIGAVGARVMQYEFTDRIYATSGTVTYLPPLIRLHGLHSKDLKSFTLPRDGDFVPGCSVLLRRKTLEHVGLFDERFFAYHEDVDWCTRAWSDNWRVSYLPSSVVYHRGAFYDRHWPLPDYSYYLYGRNSLIYARKHARRWQMVKILSLSLIYLPASVARRVAQGKSPGKAFRTAGLILLGMFDGWRGRDARLARIGLR